MLGTAQFESGYGITRASGGPFDPCGILRAASSLGFAAIDTSPAYGRAETLIAECGWSRPVHTKVRRNRAARESLDASLLALERPGVDVLYFHDPSVLDAGPGFFRSVRSQLSEDEVRYLGVSVYSPEEFKRAIAVPDIQAVQVPLNPADGRIGTELFVEADRLKKKIYVRSLFLQGLLLREPRDLPRNFKELRPLVEAMATLSQETGLSRAQLLFSWLRNFRGITGAVLGVDDPSQLFKLHDAASSEELEPGIIETLEGFRIYDSRILDPRRWRLSDAKPVGGLLKT